MTASLVRDTPRGKYLTLSRPLKVGSAACLTPDAAPPTMVALYGSQNGFGWKQGETIGAQVEGLAPSSITGTDGNQEFFICLRKPSA